jgi:4-diphosphocytidyl-2-C-methyl-D-erythritol kinase
LNPDLPRSIVDLAAASTTELAPAKVNLALHVTGRRPDGYHLLESLVVFTRFGDRIIVEASMEDRFSVSGPFAADVPTDDGNLVVRARDLLRRYMEGRGSTAPPSVLPDISPARGEIGSFDPAASPAPLMSSESQAAMAISPLAGEMSDRTEGGAKERVVSPFAVAIHLEKNLPVASGVGGGSSDAAAVLRALARLWEIEMREADLARIALGLGADVPMCLSARPLLARGIGDEISPVPDFPAHGLVLVNPGRAVATPQVFATLARRDNEKLPALPRTFDFHGLRNWLETTRNDLEPAARAIEPAIGHALGALNRAGAGLARMSGSGATCFGLFETGNVAKRAAAELRSRHPDWFVAATRSIASGDDTHG